MDRLQQTICALATPPGAGGIAVVRVSGPDTYPIVEKIFAPLHLGRKVAEAKGYTAMLGHYLLHGQEMDETIALFFRAPHSYTGEDVIELSVHGGTAMADGLLEALITAGAAPAGPGEFTRRALEHGRMSLTQAEAVMEVIAANGRQGAALAKSALDGRLAKRIGAIQTVLQSLNAHLTAWIDYPEEDVPELSDEHLLKTLCGQKAELDSLIRGYGAGAVLRRGVDCVLLGRPNVGKSTLLNLMAGFDRAIVTPVAGTTRDIVEQAVQLGEIRLNLFDTAGVRDVGADGDAIEAEGIRRSWKKLDEAGLVLAVFDAAQPLTDADLEIARRCQNRPALAILNKEDLADSTENAAQTLQPYFKKVITLCAKEADSLQPLTDAVAELLGTAQLDPGAAQLCSARQLAAATRARDAIAEAMKARQAGFGLDATGICLTDALQALCDLTGEDASDATIEEVFETFCVGK
ncbi:tRNA uridine-5-carboxymethylaminomethyl(34) synthesis GTPase MnmE [uncultured Gemmiger sp.]|uniref:tRNA uridine-5-carboxymethylaminomethyl(34) synthesis GTPase MnmE n=1 Tax=uncultured Gemmiger sp. TaxID=1623490 RepID=UPI0025E94D44|nr:tRNA uridine-5-carboxymethylaminomethyl(34) synthesis GTPase MnmE [uncultured Gemmiger sp.]